ncbi:MAG: L-rhamnose/proton symporter RhaT [Bacteroidota bacterium]|nr:L-rhamnose/proton symporter RhaT [Bacteroidota bacterium]
MTASILFGMLIIAIGAFSSGSFSIPFDKVTQWKWENSWLTFSFFAYFIVPLIICLVVVPNFTEIYKTIPSGNLLLIFIFGAIYGLANLTFGLSLRYLGVALGFCVSLGLMMVIGTLLPPMIDGRIGKMFEGNGGILLISGLIVSCLGISITAYAGILKSRKLEILKREKANTDFDFRKGLFAALFVGVTGSSMSLGFEQGKMIAEESIKAGAPELFAKCPVFLLFFAGSFLSTLIWCIYLGIKNKSLGNYYKGKTSTLITNYTMCAFASFLWFINYIFYGMGTSKMGEFTFIAWGILMSLTIVFANIWGFFRGEWKGIESKIKGLVWLGLAVLVTASFLIGISG